ncbi:MAG: branched-chain amino acid aminotransferase [Bacillota bacterium]|nr:branched-chain amino acid aminotransferase [Bacillota bacterium]
MSQRLNLTRIPCPGLKTKPEPGAKLGFGSLFTDFMFALDYTEGKGWHDARIEPYAPLELDPSCMTLHYGQTIFEGMKAYRGEDDSVRLFRPRLNFERMNVSAKRMGIPTLDVDLALQALEALIRQEADWVPGEPGTSLYIRPFIFATEGHLGVRVAKTYRFLIILSPSGAYYESGLDPVSIYIEDEYVRAVRGGTGFAKTAANYAVSLLSQIVAKERGYEQVLWLDGVERRYIEEVGSMNVFFVIDGEPVTPVLNGSILPGITRRSVLELLEHQGRPAREMRLAVDELMELARAGRVTEVFGTGTAAVISPVGRLSYGEESISFTYNPADSLAYQLYDDLTGIQYGHKPDELGWVHCVTPGRKPQTEGSL